MNDEKHSIEKLRGLYNLIKEHPYRLSFDTKFLKDYKKLLYELSDEFYWNIKETKYHLSKQMTHDFNRDISNLGRTNFKYQAETDLHVENCISVIHTFLDFGNVPKFSTLYFGSGILSAVGNEKTYIWNDELNGYYLKATKGQIPELEKKIIENEKFWSSKNEDGQHSDLIKYWRVFLENVKKFN